MTSLSYVQITGTFEDGTGSPLTGTVTFTPSATVYAGGVPVLAPDVPIRALINAGQLGNLAGGTLQLLATNNAGLTIEGLTGFWFWTVQVTLGGQIQDPWSFFLPSSPSTVDLYSLADTAASGGGTSVNGLTGGTITSSVAVTGSLGTTPVTLTDAPTITVNAALSNVQRVTLGGNRTLASPTKPADGQPLTFEVIQPASGGPYTLSYGAAYSFTASTPQPSLSTAAGDRDLISFLYDAGTALWICTGYVLAQNGVLVMIAQGGTGATTQQGAINALTGVQTAGQYLRSNGTNAGLSALLAADLPYDTTAAHILGEGTQTAGGNAQPADSGHIHPASSIVPSDHGLLAWSMDLDSAVSGTTLIAGTVYLVKVPIRYALTATYLWFSLTVAGVGTSTGSYVGLYSSAGSLLTGSADLGTAIAIGNHQVALTTPQALTAGSFVWAAMVTNQSSSQPAVRSPFNFTSPASPNIGLTAATYRIAVPAGGTTQTALPGSFTPSSNTNTGAAQLWFGIS